jgi:hypothetical protein
VVIDNLHIVNAIAIPSETDAPLIVDAYAVQSDPITFESFQSVSRRCIQFIERRYRVDLDQFPHCYAGDRVPPATHAGLEKRPGLPFREASNQTHFIV